MILFRTNNRPATSQTFSVGSGKCDSHRKLWSAPRDPWSLEGYALVQGCTHTQERLERSLTSYNSVNQEFNIQQNYPFKNKGKRETFPEIGRMPCYQSFTNSIQKTEEERRLPSSFYEVRSTLIPKLHKDIIIKDNYWPKSLGNIDTKILHKQYKQNSDTHEKNYMPRLSGTYNIWKSTNVIQHYVIKRQTNVWSL